MNRRRLTTLSKYLRNEVEPKKFNIRKWADPTYLGGGIDGDDAFCGTVACAFGYAALMPEFQAMGLALVHQRTSGPEIIIKTYNDLAKSKKLRYGECFNVRYTTHTGFYAAAVFFDLPKSVTGLLFDVEGYSCAPRHITADRVADSIDFILKNGEEAYLESRH